MCHHCSALRLAVISAILLRQSEFGSCQLKVYTACGYEGIGDIQAGEVCGNGVRCVVKIRQQKWWAAHLLRHLKAARVDRVAPFPQWLDLQRLAFTISAAPGSPG